MKTWSSLFLSLLLAVGCGRSDAGREKIGTKGGLFPDTFPSSYAAGDFVHRRNAGGRVDEVALGGRKFLVVFLHGSGLPVIGIALYEVKMTHCELLQKNKPWPPGEFLSAKASGRWIVIVGENSKQEWRLFEAK